MKMKKTMLAAVMGFMIMLAGCAGKSAGPANETSAAEMPAAAATTMTDAAIPDPDAAADPDGTDHAEKAAADNDATAEKDAKKESALPDNTEETPGTPAETSEDAAAAGMHLIGPGSNAEADHDERKGNPDENDGANLKGYVETEEEKKIYSYLQVPLAYAHDPVWTGDWTNIEAGGQQFFYFGCGICCLSNMCSTFTQTAVPPDEMMERARTEADYDPDSGVGALSWWQLKTMAKTFAEEVSVREKPSDYSRFQENIAAADTAVVLVCKDDDDKLWSYTKGHYVNIWEYDLETDTVFVTDSSSMFNRMRVQLSDIYNALKTASDAQYMTVKYKTDDTAEN